MSVATSKVRLYDLAKELKIDTKRLIEEVRREGVDVSVPSNSVSKELAEKIREKYFPKQTTTAKRAIKVVKKAARVIEEPPLEEAPIEVPIEVEAPAPEPIPVEEPEAPAKPQVTRVIKKLAPTVRAPEPESAAPPAQVAPPPADVTESPAATTPAPQPAPPPGRQVRVLRPTAAALSQGIRPGERAPAPRRQQHLPANATCVVSNTPARRAKPRRRKRLTFHHPTRGAVAHDAARRAVANAPETLRANWIEILLRHQKCARSKNASPEGYKSQVMPAT